nr:signal peptide, CUB and EGF-like domain-containing protein 1 [Procambarus clarkii]
MNLWWACVSILFLLAWAVQATGVEYGRTVVSTGVERYRRSHAHIVSPNARDKTGEKSRRNSGKYRRRRPDVCKTGRHRCDRHAVCKSFKRFHRCSCRKGWEGNGRSCKDVDECRLRNGGCVHLCTNSPGNYTCSCHPGFLPDLHDPHNCQDVNECQLDQGGCQHTCLNTLGSFSCACRDGYTLATDGRSCIASASCAALLCDQHCLLSADGGPSCGCREGYVLVRTTHCHPTCAVGNGGCQHKCQQGPTAPSCTCHPQYLLAADGHSCIPSCAINNGGCERSCHNTATGVHCSCPRGFHLHHDQRTCLDVDECSGNGSGCEHRCINNHGSYECVCPTGFKLQPDERSCQDVNECAVDGTCEHFCTNTPGSYHCSCDVGYQLFAWTHCGDMNECSINNGGCSQICVNTDGSYYCGCRDGYSLHANRKDCLPTNKCTPFRNPTKAEVSCYHLEDYSYEERCTVRCREGAAFTSGSANYYVFTCGRHTDFTWRADPDVLNTSYLSCSDMWVTPGYKRLARLMVATRLDDNTTVESVLNGLTQALTEKMSYCSDKCQLRFVSEKLTNSKKLKKKLHLAPDQQVVRTKFEVVVFPTSPRQLCGRKCLKRYARRLKKTLLEHQSISSVTGHEYQLLPRTYKAGGRVKETCPEGFVHVGRKCVACSLGSYHDVEKGVCVACPASTYQPNEAKLKCLSCPVDDLPQAPYKTGARNLSQCSDVCPAGSWSADGFSPCQPCSSGSYQEDSGRVSCSSCLPSSTSPPGATSFFQCLSHGETCDRGHYWNLTSGQCESCPLGYYQHNTGASSCIQCPGSSTTDHIASTSLAACKRHACGGYVGELSGVFETPNYPGDYPDNARCTWVVKPAKGRRVLVVVPEIQLSHDQCGDYLVLRKSKSAYSAVTFETCSSVDRPVVFTSRSRRLWVHFRSDSNNTNKGFRIQFVTYNKEYHKLIKTIVRDNRLYSLHNHLAILRDRELLPRLLEVVAEPIKYYEYATEKDKLFPSSFIRLLTPKVRRFFSYRRRRK